MKITRRRTVRAAGLAFATAAALLLTACAGQSAAAPEASAGTPVEGGTLRLAFWPDNPSFTCIDPFQVYWIETRSLLRNVVDSLTDQDPKTGKLVPWLAKSWTVNGDSTSFTFSLRDDVTFSDGTRLTADSVKLAFDDDAATAKAIPSAYGSSYLGGYVSTTVLDPHTVRVDFSRPNSGFLQATSTTNLGILAASSYAKSPAERCRGAVVGSGPFTLDSYDPAKGVELSRRDGYGWASRLNAHQGDAYLDRVSVSYVSEDSVRLGQLTSGEIDIDWPRNPFSAADRKLLESSGERLQSRSLPGISNTLFPNLSAGRVLADPLVRQALQKAIDRKSYAATIFGAGYPVVESVYDRSTPFFASQASSLGYDLAGAEKLLDRAGWKVGGDGYRHKDGATLVLDYPTSGTLPGDQLLQDQLKKAGIELDIRVETGAQYAQDRASGRYDLMPTYLTRADPTVLQSAIDTRYATALTFATVAATAAQQTELQRLFDEGLQSSSSAGRAAAYTSIQKYLVGGQDIAFPLNERVQQVGVSPKVHGFRFTSEAFLSLDDIWIQK